MTEGRRAQPPQQPPPVQRLQLRYCKRGRARFASHRDVARALERALRRALVPMAYSSGFNPHPRISYAGASATGAATEADYLELALAERRDPVSVLEALNGALPDGIAVLEAVEPRGTPGGLAQRLSVSAWRVDIVGPPADVVADAVRALLAAGEVRVQRSTMNGLRWFDPRGALLWLAAAGDRELALVLRQEIPLVRPDDVVAALGQLHDGFVLAQPALYTRLTQGEWLGGRIVGPFEL